MSDIPMASQITVIDSLKFINESRDKNEIKTQRPIAIVVSLMPTLGFARQFYFEETLLKRS